MAYITDLTHFLDEMGNIPKNSPAEARKLASFLALVVEEVTRQHPQTNDDIQTTLLCFKKPCNGRIIGTLDEQNQLVRWHCPHCGENGTISNWQDTRWDSTNPAK